MAVFQYEPLPTEGEDDKEKSPLTTAPPQLDAEHRERMHKTIFAAGVFFIVFGVVLLTLSMMETEKGLWSSRQDLIPNSQSYQVPLFLASLLELQQAWLTLNKVPMETVMWKSNETFAGAVDEVSNQAWDSMIPRTYQSRRKEK